MIFYCVGEKVEVKTFNGVDAAITAITNGSFDLSKFHFVTIRTTEMLLSELAADKKVILSVLKDLKSGFCQGLIINKSSLKPMEDYVGSEKTLARLQKEYPELDEEDYQSIMCSMLPEYLLQEVSNLRWGWEVEKIIDLLKQELEEA